jgi:hypothetical protein
MPYLAVNVSQKLSAAKKEILKAEFGRLITIIPGKAEADLMVDLADDRAMYMGSGAVPCAYIDLRVYTKADGEAKNRFTRAAFALLTRELGIKPEHQYLTITEFDHWGYDGEFH